MSYLKFKFQYLIRQLLGDVWVERRAHFDSSIHLTYVQYVSTFKIIFELVEKLKLLFWF